MDFPVEEWIQNFVLTPLSVCSVIVFTIATIYHIISKCLERCNHYPTLYFKESAFSAFLFERIPRFKEPYRLPFWAINPHVQTLLCSYSIPRNEVQYDRSFLQLKDRGLIALDWAVFQEKSSSESSLEGRPILIIVPNLTSGSDEASDLCHEAMKRNLRPVVFIRRGCDGCPLATPRFQSYGDPSDFRQAIKYLRAKFPKSQLVAIGYGTGADLLLAYFGEFGSSSYIVAASAISPFYDPEQVYAKGIPFPYEYFRLFSLKKLVSEHSGALSKTLDVSNVLNTKTLRHFEQAVYGRMANCDSDDQYWEKNAPLRDADDIATPILCISSTDDPIVPKSVIPYDIFNVYPHFLLVETNRGGHCGFLQAAFGKVCESWAGLLSLDFLEVCLEFSRLEDSPEMCSNGKR